MKKSGMTLLAMALASAAHADEVTAPSAESAPAREAAVPAASSHEALEFLVLVASDPEALDTVPARISPERTGEGELQLALAAGAATNWIPAAAAVAVGRESDGTAAAVDDGALEEPEDAWLLSESSLESPWDAWENRESMADARDAWNDAGDYYGYDADDYYGYDAGNDYWDDASNDQWDDSMD